MKKLGTLSLICIEYETERSIKGIPTSEIYLKVHVQHSVTIFDDTFWCLWHFLIAGYCSFDFSIDVLNLIR